MVPHCVLPVFGWSIGDMTPTDTAANGVVRQPVGKWTAVPAKIPVPTPLMADASIPNLIGISAFILHPVPRGTTEYKKIYNNRTGSERVNNRILNDYHLHDMRIHGKKRYSFFAIIAGINIHLDARLKKQKMDAAS